MDMLVNLPSLPSLPWFFLLFLTTINQSFSGQFFLISCVCVRERNMAETIGKVGAGKVCESGSVFVGKAQGMYVASSEDGSSHTMAMTISFVNGEYKGGLRLFGVHRRDDNESHVAFSAEKISFI
ncbi:hypothetical protein RHSIM_Rhsim05G0006200 [Rhododendron simsii]|uniref:Dirigent protein n=1 Tax=Rhododendron simsii TaxID=118357 RepID=A0A834LJV0_RHOSS|nr:hypothetical protein RHSIM_Rhsim05G0006200 [Rhododendron simsii]